MYSRWQLKSTNTALKLTNTEIFFDVSLYFIPFLDEYQDLLLIGYILNKIFCVMFMLIQIKRIIGRRKKNSHFDYSQHNLWLDV